MSAQGEIIKVFRGMSEKLTSSLQYKVKRGIQNETGKIQQKNH